LSAPPSDFKVSGSPVSKSGTLALTWNVAPTSAGTVNAIVKRDSTGSFSAKNITANSLTASNAAGVAIVASTSASTAAIKGTSTGTNAVSDGVDGISNSITASGVAGINNSGGIGVVGTGGTGVNGVAGGNSATGVGEGGFGAGVWGDSGAVAKSGVLGTADDGSGVKAVNNSATDTFTPALLAANFSSTAGALVFQTVGLGNGTNHTCTIDVNANLLCVGSKSAVVPVEKGQKMVALYAQESPENWFEDFGSGQLVSGMAVITLEPTFAQTVNTGTEYHVFLTPKGDCKGLYVTNETSGSFEVRETQSGHSNIAFDYRIVAHRKGFEKVRLEDKTAMMKAAQANAARFGRKAAAPAKLGATTK